MKCPYEIISLKFIKVIKFVNFLAINLLVYVKYDITMF